MSYQIIKTTNAGADWSAIAQDWEGYACVALDVTGPAGARKLWLARELVGTPPAEPGAGTPAELLSDGAYVSWYGLFVRISDTQAYFYDQNSSSDVYRSVVTAGDPTVIANRGMLTTDLGTLEPHKLLGDEKPDSGTCMLGPYGSFGGAALCISLADEAHIKGVAICEENPPFYYDDFESGVMLNNVTLIGISQKCLYVVTDLDLGHMQQGVVRHADIITQPSGTWYQYSAWRVSSTKIVWGGVHNASPMCPVVHLATFDSSTPPAPTYEGYSLCPYVTAYNRNYRAFVQLTADTYFFIYAYDDTYLLSAKVTISGTTISWGSEENIWAWESGDDYQLEFTTAIGIDANRVGILYIKYDETAGEYSYRFAVYTLGVGLGDPIVLYTTSTDILGNRGYLGKLTSSTLLASYYTADYKRMVVTINV